MYAPEWANATPSAQHCSVLQLDIYEYCWALHILFGEETNIKDTESFR